MSWIVNAGEGKILTSRAGPKQGYLHYVILLVGGVAERNFNQFLGKTAMRGS